MLSNWIYILLALLIVVIVLKCFKFAIRKILEIALLLVLLYIGFKIFTGDYSIFYYIQNILQ